MSAFLNTKISLVAALVAVVVGGVDAAAAPAKVNAYSVAGLVSDVPGVAANLDPRLATPWGLAAQQSSPWWVANEGTGVATLYQPDGSSVPLTVQLTGGSFLPGPTGVVGNADPTFLVSAGGNSRPAAFLFATLSGEILGWNPVVNPTAAVVAATTPGAAYTGLAAGSTAGGDLLYATDFADGRVDVFDQNFQPASTAGGFSDPALPTGFAPFGIQNVDGTIVVTFAKKDANGRLLDRTGLGVVDLFDTSGKLLGRVGAGGELNAPWGVAKAPAQGFGRFSGDLLIGNHGDGRITAFESKDGEFKSVGQLALADETPLTIDGLWALQFGKGATSNGPATTLFFTAGPPPAPEGLFGSITPITTG